MFVLGEPWTVQSVTGLDAGDDYVGDPIELILYGDKGQSRPVLIGVDKEFRFTKGHTDTFMVSL